MADEPPTKRTRAPGDRARARIVEQAAELATVEGLDGVSIGRLADATGVPKSSVHALFGSKEELQLATIGAARDSFITEVVSPALVDAKPGRERLAALCEGFLSYVERRVFPGGCFFVAAAAELGVILAGTNLVAVLHNDNNAIERARSAIRTRLTR